MSPPHAALVLHLRWRALVLHLRWRALVLQRRRSPWPELQPHKAAPPLWPELQLHHAGAPLWPELQLHHAGGPLGWSSSYTTPEVALAPDSTSSAPTATALPPSPTCEEKMSKANWSLEMTTIFCNLTAIEKEKGNMPLKFLNPAGYKNAELGFIEQTEKHYSRLQFKNKWGSLRTLYKDWPILKNTYWTWLE